LLAPAASPPIQRGRRLIGCTPRGGRPHEKAPRSGGAKVDHEGVAEMQKRATPCGLTLAWVAAFIQSHAPSSSGRGVVIKTVEAGAGYAFAVKGLRINSMLAAAIIRQKSKIKQSRTRRQSIATRVRSIPNSAYVRKLYVPFVFLTNLEQEDDDHRSCLSPIIADIVRSPRWRPGCLGFSFALRRPFRSHSTSYSKWHLQTGDVTNL